MKLSAEWRGENKVVIIESDDSYSVTGAFDRLDEWAARKDKTRRDAIEEELREKIEAEKVDDEE